MKDIKNNRSEYFNACRRTTLPCNIKQQNLFKNITTDEMLIFLKRNKVWWSHLIEHELGYLCIPTNVAQISNNSNNKLDLLINGKRDMNRVEITENSFLIFDDNFIVLDLSNKWLEFLNRFEIGLNL